MGCNIIKHTLNVLLVVVETFQIDKKKFMVEIINWLENSHALKFINSITKE